MRAKAVLARVAAPLWVASGTSASSGAIVQPVDCTWPTCARRCNPCETKPVGTCVLSLAKKDFPACDASRGPTECFLGSCVCDEAHCASEDGESCVPLECSHRST